MAPCLRRRHGKGLGTILGFGYGGTYKDLWANVKGGVHKDYKERNKGMKVDALPRNLRTTMLLPWEALCTYHRDPST